MSQNSSITEDHPRNDNEQRQDDKTMSKSTNCLFSFLDIVHELAALSWRHRDAIYILSGTGYISQASLLSITIPAATELECKCLISDISFTLEFLMIRLGYKQGRMQILHLSGWFHPMTSTNLGGAIPCSRSNGILHVSLLGVPQGVAIAANLFTFGIVNVDVVFVCGPGSVFQLAPGGPIRRIGFGLRLREG